MTLFIKIIGCILIAIVLELVLSKSNKDVAMVLSIMTVCLIVICAISYLEPVLSFFRRLEITGNFEPGLLKILLKAVGIAALSEITILLCSDSGNQALGRCLQIAATSVILWLSVPLFEKLIEVIENILETL